MAAGKKQRRIKVGNSKNGRNARAKQRRRCIKEVRKVRVKHRREGYNTRSRRKKTEKEKEKDWLRNEDKVTR